MNRKIILLAVALFILAVLTTRQSIASAQSGGYDVTWNVIVGASSHSKIT